MITVSGPSSPRMLVELAREIAKHDLLVAARVDTGQMVRLPVDVVDRWIEQRGARQ